MIKNDKKYTNNLLARPFIAYCVLYGFGYHAEGHTSYDSWLKLNNFVSDVL